MQVHSEFNERDFGHGASGSVLHPVVAVALLVAIVLMLWKPRKYVIIPFLLCAFLVPRGQELMIGGAHLYTRLILSAAGFIRVVKGGFHLAGGFNVIDKVFVIWALYRSFAVVVTDWPGANMEQLALLVTVMTGYFLLRYLIQSEDDVARAAKTLAVIALILGVSMVYERHALVNPFGTYLGGVPTVPEIRNDAARAQATFGHSILAGCFGGTLIPLFVWLWSTRARIPAAAGLVGATLMVLMANSSTPVLAYVSGVLGLLLWPVRRKMKAVRWLIVIFLVVLAFGMNAPVWFVIAHVDVVGGSGGYDRAVLIDTCMRHIKDWWLIGTNQMGGWGYDMWDMSDQFVAEAETGGLIALLCFIALISLGFSRLGKMRRRVRPKQQWLLWCLGAIMLSNIFAYFGVAYWDQSQIWWFAFISMICAMTIPPKAVKVSRPAPAVSATASFDREQEAEAAPAAPVAVGFADFQKPVSPWGSHAL